MYVCNLTKAELVNRLTGEYERLIYNFSTAKEEFEKEIYQRRAKDLESLFKLLEIQKVQET